MRKNLLKTLGTALLLTAAAWSASAEAPPGTVIHKKWYRFGGDLNALKSFAEFPNQPNEMRALTSIEDPSPDNGNNEQYGTLIQGYIVPPVNGNYKFYISSDDASELYLSSDDTPANKVKIANEPQWNGPRQYISGSNQNSRTNAPASLEAPANISAAITLTAGQKYYFEVIHQEGGGGNNVSVAWDVPGEPVVANGSLPIQGISTYASLGGITWTNLLPYETIPSAASRSYYAGIGGGAVTDLTNNQNAAHYPYYPTEYVTLGKLEETAPDNGAYENYGSRLQALISPPVTGAYDFYISADDGAAIYLSTDENPNNKVLLAREPSWNGSRDYVGTARRNASAPENRSTTLFPAGITLQAGQKYYIEALMKEGGGGNNMAVAWAAHGTAIASGSLPISTVSTVPGVPGGPFTNLYPILPKVMSASDSPIANRVAVTFNTRIQDASANNPANYTISGGLNITGAAIQGDKQSVVLTTDAPLVVGTTYTVTASGIKDALAGANPMSGSSSASFLARAAVMGSVRVEYYDGIGGTTVNDLLNSFKFQNLAPDSIVEATSFNSQAGRADNYGVRITGYIIPSASANYAFQLNSDDSSIVRMSGSADQKGRVQLVRDDACCANRDTVAIPLLAGRAYSIQALMKEGGGGDNLDLRWSGGDIGGTKVNIDSAHIAYMATPVSIATQPVGATIMEGQDYTFTVQPAGDPNFTYQWRTNGVDVPGATGKNFTLTYVNSDLNGVAVSVVVQNYTTGTPAGIGPYTAVSSDAILNVVADEVPPTIVSANAGPTYNQVRVLFSEPVVDSTTIGASFVQLTANNFALTDVDNNTPLLITNVIMLNNLVAVLETDTPLVNPGNPLQPFHYLVQAYNVVDAAPSHNPPTVDPMEASFSGAIIDPAENLGKVLVERFDNLVVNGWFLRDLTNNVNYPWYPTDRSTRTNMNIPQTGGAAPGIENFGYRARSFLIPSESGNYQFRVGADDSAALFLGTSSDPATKTQIAGAEAGTGCAACGYANSASNIRLEAGKMYYIEAIMLEGGGGDWLNVQWRNSGSIASFTDIPSENFALFIDPSKINLAISGVADLTTNDCTVLTYNAKVTGGDASYLFGGQWYVDGTPVPNATNLSFTTPQLSGGDHSIQFDASLIGKTVSAVSAVHIEGDPIPPTVVSAKADGTLQKVFLTFNKPLEPTEATGGYNYNITDPQNNPIVIQSVSLDATGTKVTLLSQNQLPDGVTLNVSVVGQFDLCGNAQDPAEIILSVTTPKLLPGYVTFETYGDPGNAGGIGGNNVNNLLLDPRYPNSPRETLFIGALDTRLGYPDDSHEAYGGRMSGYFTPTVTDNYIFYTKGDDGQRFRMNTNDVDSANPAGAVTLVDTGDQCCQGYADRPTPAVRLNAGQRYYFEALWKEGGGGDFQQVAFKPATDPTDPNTLPPIGCAYLSTTYELPVIQSRPGAPKILPTAGKLNIGSLNNRGFQVHMVQVATNINNNTAEAERMLACLAGPNVAGQPSFISQKLNYNIPGQAAIGRLQPDDIFPGTPGRTGNNDNLALEALTYLELQPGLYTLDVNSDDGFRVSPATSVGDANNSITLGEFSGGRGSSDTYFQIIVTEPGLYPFRVIWEQGGGGGNLEFMSVSQCPGVAFTAINDDAGIKAYLPPLAPLDTTQPEFVFCATNQVLLITNGCSAIIPDLLPQVFAADCYSVVTVSQDPPAGTVVSGAGTQVITFTATDDSGNSATCTATLTIVDGAAPVITACAANATVEADANCQGVVPDLTGQVTATDGCGGAVTVTQLPAAGASIPAGANVITLTATDAAGNSSTCTATVTVAPAGPAPALTISQSGPDLVISWTSATPCWKLQGTGSLPAASWTTIEGHSPITVPIDSPMRFFRLITAPNP